MSVRLVKVLDGKKYYWSGVLEEHETYTKRWWTTNKSEASVVHPMDADIMTKKEFKDQDIEIEYIEID